MMHYPVGIEDRPACEGEWPDPIARLTPRVDDVSCVDCLYLLDEDVSEAYRV